MTLPAEDSAACLVEVGPFRVVDSSKSDLIRNVVAGALMRRRYPLQLFALHVGGLNSRHDRDFVTAMHQADVVYADGGSVVLLARLAGARQVERSPTTDVGWDILQALGAELGRPPRVALLGGEPHLADRAAAVLSAGGAADIVFTGHGYHDDWTPVLAALRDAVPDVTVVGLGAPREMIWVQNHLEELPGSLVMTCGGWFGHLTGAERRAPRLLRRSGLEWLARLAQAPRRLAPRYARGLGSTVILMVLAVLRRARQAV